MIVKKITVLIIGAVALLSSPGNAETAKLRLKALPGQSVSMDPAQHDGKVNADFPEPTDVRDIAKAFSLWTGIEYVVDDRVHAKVKLVSPERITKEEAQGRFHRMLASYNLSLVEDGSNYRIVMDTNSRK